MSLPQLPCLTGHVPPWNTKLSQGTTRTCKNLTKNRPSLWPGFGMVTLTWVRRRLNDSRNESNSPVETVVFYQSLPHVYLTLRNQILQTSACPDVEIINLETVCDCRKSLVLHSVSLISNHLALLSNHLMIWDFMIQVRVFFLLPPLFSLSPSPFCF